MKITFDMPDDLAEEIGRLPEDLRNLYTEQLWQMALYALDQRSRGPFSPPVKEHTWRPFTPENVLPDEAARLIAAALRGLVAVREQEAAKTEAEPFVPKEGIGSR